MSSGGGNAVKQVVDILIQANPNALREAAEAARLDAEMKAPAAADPAVGQTYTEFASRLVGLQAQLDRTSQMMSMMSGGIVVNAPAAGRALIGLGARDRGHLVPRRPLRRSKQPARHPGQPGPGGRVLAGAAEPLDRGHPDRRLGRPRPRAQLGGRDGILRHGRVRSEAEEMEELAKATERTADEQERLNFHKEREAAVKAQESAKTAEETEQKKAVEEAVAGPDRDAIIRGLVDTSPDLLEAIDTDAGKAGDAARAREEALRKVTQGTAGTRERTPEEYAEALEADPELQALREVQRDKLKEAAAKLMGTAAIAPVDLQVLIDRVNASPSSFPKGLADKLGAATAAGQAETREIEKEAHAIEKEVGERLHAIGRRIHDAAGDVEMDPAARVAAIKEELDELNRSGMVGADVRRAREQAEDALAAAQKHERREAKKKADAGAKEAMQGVDAEVAATDLEGSSNLAAFHRARQRRSHGIRGRIADVSRDPEMVAEAKQAEIGKIIAEINEHTMVLGSKLVEDLERAARGTSIAVAKRSGADRKKDVDEQAKDIGEGLRDEVALAIARNKALLLQGVPAARDAREFDNNVAMFGGSAYAPDFQAQQLRAAVTRRVAAPGRPDAQAVAARIVGEASDDDNKRSSRAFMEASRTMNQVAATNAAMLDTIGRLAAEVQGMKAQDARARGHLQNVQGQVRLMNGQGGGTQFPFPFAPFQ